MIWSYGVSPIRASGPPMTMTVLPITMQKKKQKKPHASYTARARASWRAIYVYYAYELNTKSYRQFCSKHGGLRLLAGGCTIEEVEVDATVD
jgi:hypothetical protein